MSRQVTRLVAETPQLTWLNGNAADGVTLLSRSIVVGREPNRCDVLLDSDMVSRQHARFVPAGDGHVELTDLDSSNGTFVNGRRTASALLSDGDRIGFGSGDEVHCVFRAGPRAPAVVEQRAGDGDAEEAATALLSGELKRCPECSRVVTSALSVCRYCSQGRAACGSCGVPAREGGSYCHRCGARLTG